MAFSVELFSNRDVAVRAESTKYILNLVTYTDKITFVISVFCSDVEEIIQNNRGSLEMLCFQLIESGGSYLLRIINPKSMCLLCPHLVFDPVILSRYGCWPWE
jgi:hypothetical protein